jgi:hypothetical protein
MRKQILLVAIIFICCIQASAQLDKGSIYTGISSENRFYSYGNVYGFKPELSYAIDKHNSIGVRLNNFRSNNDLLLAPNIDGYYVQNGVGITYNYYRYFKNSKKLGWYLNGNLDFNRINYYDLKSSGERELLSRHNHTELSIRPGLFYNPSHNIMVFANVGGISLTNTEGRIRTPLNFGNEVNIGVLINLDIFRKKK